MSVPYLGDLFIFGSFITVILSLICYFLAWRGKDHLLQLGRNFFYAATAFVSGAIIILLYLILTHDFTVAYVFSYSSTDLPLGFLISSLWGGQEGTFLLWIFFVVLMALVMIRTAGSFEKGNMVFVNLFLLSIIIILLKKSPFELMPVLRTEGAGLNPLLQNFWMQIHPPIMFVGFAGVVFPFAFAMTGLVEKKYTQWAESARRWTMFTWIALGTALVMGGYWAYVTLGWGGFWAWDPVENSSFIPWIFLAAQVHVLFINRVRKGMMRFSLWMVSLSFWSVLYGTFLTRSGVLADFSVHSFVDLGLNNFLVGGTIFFVLLGSFLIFYRWKDISPNPSFSKITSKSYLVTLGVLVLFIGGFLTLIGTSAPLLTRLAEEPSAVGLDYYFVTMTPIAIAVMLFIGLFPAFRWNNGVSKPKLLIIGGSVFTLTVATLLITGFTYSLMYLLFFGTAAMALINNSFVLIESFRQNKFIPGYLAHIGIALAMVGAGLSAGFETKQTLRLPMNEQVQAMGYNLKFTQMVDNPKGFDAYVEIDADEDHFIAKLPHEFPKNQEGVMRKPHVEKYLTKDVYVAPVAMEQTGQNDPSLLEFSKGETKTIDKYSITFNDYDLSSHGESGMTTAGAKLTITYDDKSEDITPVIAVSGDSVLTEHASFDYENGHVTIAGIKPETGSVFLKFMGDFIPKTETAQNILVIELSKKPLINLFWFGTILCFLSGALSMRKRFKRTESAQTEYIDVENLKKEAVS
ncbi:MAG: hypothetical protein DWP97_12535 [Calditrichaeota bacterium]|nr:MAG: hypothetical protein DWP97_12535 [Calditrichota bacterium]